MSAPRAGTFLNLVTTQSLSQQGDMICSKGLKETKALPCLQALFLRDWTSPGGTPYCLTCPVSASLWKGVCPPLQQLRVLVGLPIIESHPLPGLGEDQVQHLTHLALVTGPGERAGTQPTNQSPSLEFSTRSWRSSSCFPVGVWGFEDKAQNNGSHSSAVRIVWEMWLVTSGPKS